MPNEKSTEADLQDFSSVEYCTGGAASIGVKDVYGFCILDYSVWCKKNDLVASVIGRGGKMRYNPESVRQYVEVHRATKMLRSF